MKLFIAGIKNDVWVNTTDDMLELYRRSSGGQKEFACLFNFSETSSFSFTLPSSQLGWNKIIDSNDEQWLIDERDYKPVAGLLQPGEKIMIPPLTVIAYGN
jgi:hypothetical protein